MPLAAEIVWVPVSSVAGKVKESVPSPATEAFAVMVTWEGLVTVTTGVSEAS